MRNVIPLAVACPEFPVRASPRSVREERLRATADLKRPGTMAAWRGRSGRRYVVNVYPLAVQELPDIEETVAIAVRRGADGTARVVDLAAPETGDTPRTRLRWLERTRRCGATELHVHLLADNEAERRAVLRDLSVG